MVQRPPTLELRVVSESGRTERALALPRTARAALLAGALSLLGGLITVAAVTPSAIRAYRGHREYDLQVARRSQLGARLRALVEGLARLDRQTQDLERHVARLAAIYGIGGTESPPPEEDPGARADRGSIFAGAVARGLRLAGSAGARLERVDRGLAVLAAWEAAQPPETASLPVRSPVPEGVSVPTSGFGTRRVPGGGELEFHAGLDFAAAAGTEVAATADGVVIWSGEAPSTAGPAWWRLGRMVVIRHDDRFVTLFGHCERVIAPRGRRVRSGETIATVGASGWTGTPQLHYEIRRRSADGSWAAVDPRLFLLASEPPAQAPAETPPGGLGPPALPRAFQP
jgi:murein DD-endopeptidase MepM/ murein hydrolase activator NlpD